MYCGPVDCVAVGSAQALAFFGFLASFSYAVLADIISYSQLQTLMQANMLIFTASRVPQIVQSYRNKSTGQLDLFMILLQTGGSLSRVFTTLQEVDDVVYLSGFILGAALNLTMLAQLLYYGSGSGKGAATAAGTSPGGRKTRKVE